jgi:hypothetical protein
MFAYKAERIYSGETVLALLEDTKGLIGESTHD